MTAEGRMAFQAKKSADIIKSLCVLYGISIQEATDIYYQSETSELIEESVADLQCRSEKYLASLVWDEYEESVKNNRDENSSSITQVQ